MSIYGVSHSLCDDGNSSAWVVRRKIPNIITIFDNYDGTWQKTKYKEGDFIYFTDISPLPKDAEELIKIGADFVVYDHHQTAINNLQEYKNNSKDEYGILKKFHLELDNCGAVLTWKNLFPDEKLPRLLAYIDIADLWKWKQDPDARAICRYIRLNLRSNNINSFQNLIDTIDFEKAKYIGGLWMEQADSQIEKLFNNKLLVDFDGTKLFAVNDSLYASEVGHELETKSPSGLGMVYYIRAEDKLVKVSIRGRGARIFCQKFGGGGHDVASAFTMPIEKFFNLFKILDK